MIRDEAGLRGPSTRLLAWKVHAWMGWHMDHMRLINQKRLKCFHENRMCFAGLEHLDVRRQIPPMHLQQVEVGVI
ncbi:hypothetical protein [Stenotrophomonas sp.]|uniref:hypothetical protein n=1 Tax=Stenotrophomonas sp. TaxID=69392 RepID=UPI00289DC95E|nr:hypothetical protein [Stenotrophomonas sp.]